MSPKVKDWTGGVGVVRDARPGELPVPLTCTRFQGRMALGAERCAQLDAIAADPATPWATREAIANTTEWIRNSPLVDSIGAAFGLSSGEIDDLFAAARSIEV